MRVHAENLDATDVDVLSGTALDQLEAGGQLDIFILSTQADGAITITGPDTEPIIQGAEIQQETRAIRPTDDLPLSLSTPVGGHYTVAYTENTGAVAPFLAIYRKAGVDF
jgi:hypothetical protein